PNVADSPVLASIASVEPRQAAESKGCTRALELTGTATPPAGKSECSRPRALQLSGDATSPAAPAQSSLAVRNQPADALTVEVSEFTHGATTGGRGGAFSRGREVPPARLSGKGGAVIEPCSISAPIVRVDDPADPRLGPYRAVRDRQLLAEGT